MTIYDVLCGDSNWALAAGDALDILKQLPDHCIDAIVTDPPGAIDFMGRGWDYFENRERYIAFLRVIFTAARRVARPNANALVWSHPKTSHWTATALEDSGWPIQNRVVHLYGNGLNKGKRVKGDEDWATSLRPGSEDWILCGTGPVNLAACANESGRMPTNVALSHSIDCDANICAASCPVSDLDAQSGLSKSRKGKPRKSAKPGRGYGVTHTGTEYNDAGGASRYFPVFRYAKRATTAEKNAGCEDLYWKPSKTSSSGFDAVPKDVYDALPEEWRANGNIHQTVKSLDFMRWLCSMITPKTGIVLDMFAGSCSTGVSCLRNGFRFVGVDLSPEYIAIGNARMLEAAKE